MWRFETLIKGMRARKDRPEVAVRMEAGLVDVEYGEGEGWWKLFLDWRRF